MIEFHHGKYIVTRPKEKLVKPDWGARSTPTRLLP
jgi:hypothetical protein